MLPTPEQRIVSRFETPPKFRAAMTTGFESSQRPNAGKIKKDANQSHDDWREQRYPPTIPRQFVCLGGSHSDTTDMDQEPRCLPSRLTYVIWHPFAQTIRGRLYDFSKLAVLRISSSVQIRAIVSFGAIPHRSENQSNGVAGRTPSLRAREII